MIIYSTDEYPAFVEAAGAYIPSSNLYKNSKFIFYPNIHNC